MRGNGSSWQNFGSVSRWPSPSQTTCATRTCSSTKVGWRLLSAPVLPHPLLLPCHIVPASPLALPSAQRNHRWVHPPPPPESHWEDVPMGEDGERISSSPPPESHWEDVPMGEDGGRISRWRRMHLPAAVVALGCVGRAVVALRAADDVLTRVWGCCRVGGRDAAGDPQTPPRPYTPVPSSSAVTRDS